MDIIKSMCWEKEEMGVQERMLMYLKEGGQVLEVEAEALAEVLYTSLFLPRVPKYQLQSMRQYRVSEAIVALPVEKTEVQQPPAVLVVLVGLEV